MYKVRYTNDKKGILEDWDADPGELFATREDAETALHTHFMDGKINELIEVGDLEALRIYLRANPDVMVLPRIYSAGRPMKYTSVRKAMVLAPLYDGSKELDGNLINSYFCLLQRSTGLSGHVFLHTHLLSFPHDQIDETKLRNHVAEWDLLRQEDLHTVYLPVHVDHNHWYLAILNSLNSRYEIWDSLARRRQPTKYYGLIVEKLRLLKEILFPGQPKWTDLSNVPHEGAARQQGILDCGAFVCKFASEFLRNGTAEHVSRAAVQNGNAFRNEMLVALCKGSL